jgi:subfamily B ATP-binding cassette protein MsbA
MRKFFEKIKSFIKNDNPETQIKWSLYGRVWAEVGRPQWRWLLAGIVCTILSAAAEAYSIILVKNVIDQGFLEKNMSSLYLIAIQIVAAFGFKSIFAYSKTLLMAKAGLLAATNLRRRIYRHMVKMHIGLFNKSEVGKLMNYYSVQAAAVLNLVTDSVISMVQNSATMIFMLILMLWYAPQMFAVLLFLVPAIIIPMMIIMRKKRKLTRESFTIAGTSTTHVNQTIQGIKTIQSFATEESEAVRFDSIERTNIRNSYKQIQVGGIQSPLLEIMISIGLGLALIVGGYFITTGQITMGGFVAFILALTAAYQPAKRLTGVSGGIQNGLIGAEQLFEFLDTRSEIKDAADAKVLKPGPMNVKLKNVSFAYNTADGEVLHDVTMDVMPGTICAIVGPSGGGKSTIFNLLERFYDPQKGSVLINGKDIRKYTLASIRNNIAIVSQDVFLFNGSVADNIKYGAPNATQKEIEEAAKAANAHEFVKELPQGYKTKVGERGALLSGGQKQRIAIARAILKNSPILLLDEATSALDTQSEKLIQAALKKLMVGRTTFVIAHRLSTILDADQICVIMDGRITERGTDKELTKAAGDYKKLKDIQFKKDK